MGFTTYWVQFWYPLSTQTSQPSCRFPFEATILSFFSHLLPSNRDHHKIKKYYQTTAGQQEKTKLIGIPNSNFNFHNDLLYHGQRLYIPSTTNLRPSILHEFHETPSIGHSGLKATLARLVASFYWPGMYRDTKTFITECLPWKQNKPINKKPLGLLQPIPPNQNLGWTNNWFYHSLTIIIRPYNYLGGLWPTFKISSFHSPSHVLHRLPTSQPFFCGDLQVAWHSKIHNLRPRPALPQ